MARVTITAFDVGPLHVERREDGRVVVTVELDGCSAGIDRLFADAMASGEELHARVENLGGMDLANFLEAYEREQQKKTGRGYRNFPDGTTEPELPWEWLGALYAMLRSLQAETPWERAAWMLDNLTGAEEFYLDDPGAATLDEEWERVVRKAAASVRAGVPAELAQLLDDDVLRAVADGRVGGIRERLAPLRAHLRGKDV